MTFKRRFYVFGCTLFCLIFCCAPVAASMKVPNHTSEFFVNDFAGVLSSDVKSYINQKSQQYDKSDGTQIVVATVHSLEGNSIEAYSLEMARSWGIGSKENNNGLLILLAVEEREIRVEVGYGLEGTITDSLSGRFIRAVTPELSEDNYSDGIKNLYDLILQELEEPGAFEETEEGKDISSLIIMVIVIFILLSGGFWGPRGRRRRRGYYGSDPFYGSGFGGFGGGGGFSGGGGSFGGGGSSGKF